MNLTLKTNNNIVYSCKYHIVFCPKYRKKVLHGEVEKKLKSIIKNVCKEKKADLIEIECNEDHVHLLLEVDPQFGVHKLIKLIKGRSSFVLRDTFPFLKTTLPSMWTNSYFVSTVGGVTIDVVKKYVESQKTRT